MRIEGGFWRGHPLQAPNGNATRPTDGRTREMLFNSLGEFVVGARVLDLYAGSGAVGLEALSRGAASCVFVELEHGALRALRANVKKFRAADRTQIWSANARTAPQKLADDRVSFDFIFADPPFSHPNEGAEIARRLDALPGLLNNERVESSTRASNDELTLVGEGANLADSPNSTERESRSTERESRSTERESRGEGWIVVQHSRRVELPPLEHFEVARLKRAGESMLAFLRARSAHNSTSTSPPQ